MKLKELLRSHTRLVFLLSTLVAIVLIAVTVEHFFDTPYNDSYPAEKDENGVNNDEKTTPGNNGIPDAKPEVSHFMDKVELSGIFYQGVVRGDILQQKTGRTGNEAENYAVLLVEDDIVSLEVGELVLEEWELTRIDDYRVVFRTNEKVVELFLYK